MGKRKRRETNLSVETGPLNVSHHAASGSVLLSPPSSGAGPLTGKEDTTTSTSKKTKRRKKKSRRTREEGETADPEASDGFRKSSAGPTGLQMSSPEALRLDNAASSHVGGDSPDFPFPTDPDDHCESPLVAYTDIAPLVRRAMADAPNGIIYDPYYCNGSVSGHLQSLGFPNVYNRKEDCYTVWSTPSQYPSFHALITNPPYSADHMERLLHHITSPSFGTRPWFLLLPNWVVKKDYYQRCTTHIHPFYIVPTKRYVYVPPKHFRTAKPSDVHKKSAPFVSMWYIWGGTIPRNEELIRLFHRTVGHGSGSGPIEALCQLARSKSALRDLRRKQR